MRLSSTLYIVPDASSPHDFLIGRPWCEAPEISYIKYNRTLTFYNTTAFPFSVSDVVPAASGMDRLTVRDTTRLEPRHVTLVTAMVNGHAVQVPVGNCTDEDVVVQANQVLAMRAVVKTVSHNDDAPFEQPLTYEHIQRPEMLTTVQQSELIDLLNKYRQCFALSLSELGCTDVGEMDIKLKPGSEPYAAKPYRVSPDERDEISQHIRRWREQGIVEDSSSPHAAPVLLVRKKTGESRLVVDYRRLNEQTVKQVYPLPNIDDLLERMAGSCMYTVLDLAHGYLQIPLAEHARPLTGFITPEGTGQFTRMVFGLRNAPFEFAKIMDRTTGPLKNNIVLNYFKRLGRHERATHSGFRRIL